MNKVEKESMSKVEEVPVNRKKSKNQTAGAGAVVGLGVAETVGLLTGNLVVKVEVQVLREISDFIDRLFAGRDMQPGATTNAHDSISVNRQREFLAEFCAFFKSQNITTLPKDDSTRRKLLQEARNYEARELVRVLSGHLERAGTVGAETLRCKCIQNKIVFEILGSTNL
mmetsp:Transcript_12132/g.28971  ORF Transcript_12132/g.28971 Transcript_12132/m.28971 type:complete len:170 (-) Transcript_12132:786-1295(-)|eukprot:3013118-Rhodomonas_salina.1